MRFGQRFTSLLFFCSTQPFTQLVDTLLRWQYLYGQDGQETQWHRFRAAKTRTQRTSKAPTIDLDI
jgi:hypothetical protein